MDVLGDTDGLCTTCGEYHPRHSQPHAFRGRKPTGAWVRYTKNRTHSDGQTTPGVTPQLRERILTRDRHTCGYCGTTTGPFHIDHIIPAWHGGTSQPLNLVTACIPCNTTKSASLDPAWLEALTIHGAPRMRLRARNLLEQHSTERPHTETHPDGTA